MLLAALRVSPTRRPAAAAARDQRRASASHRYPLPPFPIFSLSQPVARLTACVRAGTVKVQRCCIDHTHTHSRCPVPGGTAPHSPDAPVRACIHLRLTTDDAPHRTARRHAGRCTCVRPYVRSARVMSTCNRRTGHDRNDVTGRRARSPADVTDANFLSH